MKNVLAFTLLGLSFSLPALAATPAPWNSMAGKYSISEACSIDSEAGFTKVQITALADGKRLEMKAYKGSSASTQYIPIANYQTPAQGTDGDVFFAVQSATETSFVSTENFVRKGSTSWPDLEMLDGYSLSLENGILTYKTSHQDTYSKNGPKVSTCVMTAVAPGKEVQSAPITSITDKDLAQVAQAAHDADTSGMDLDQASFQFATFKVSTTKLTHDEIVEVLNLQVPFENVEIKSHKVVSQQPEAVAKKALKTAFGVVEKSELQNPEYASLWALKNEVVKLLSLKKSNLKVIFIEWAESDSDGEGLLIMDESNGESFYFGSGYFS